ncbi:MAG: hypothetical protein K1060chlam1_01395 [Candidatus Anoxychlamydiales bacterium]|nr:hypothetical protein [Candidatus Anoxychlamydiales bacterium]
MAAQIYPQYHQYSTPHFSYLFKFTTSASLILKVSSVAQKVVVKLPLSREKLGKEYFDIISTKTDLSVVLEHLVKIEMLSREYFPVSTRIEQIQQFIQSKDWFNAEKEALEGLQQGSEAEKIGYYQLLEKIYNASNPEKLEELWFSQGKACIEVSQLSEAEKIYEKAFKRFESFNAAFNLAHLFNKQKAVDKSVQIYYKALGIALLNGELEKVSLCIQVIREIDPTLETLDSNQKMQLLMQSQLLKVSTTLHSHQRGLFRFLTVIPGKHLNTQLDSLLYNAVVQGEVGIITMVLEHSDLVDINAYLPNEPLIITAAQRGNEAIVKALLTHPDIDIDCKRSSPPGTALAIAEQAGHKSIVDILHSHSKTLAEDLFVFQNKSLEATEHLHIYIYQDKARRQCLIFIGIDQRGTRKLLDISCQSKQTLQHHLKRLEERGLKEVKFMTMTENASTLSRRASPPPSSLPSIYSEPEEIRTKLGAGVADVYKEISEKIFVLIKFADSTSFSEAVIYRAIKLKGKGYFTP